MIRLLDLYILLFLNKSNLIFISPQFQISALNKQESQSSPRFLVTLFVCLCSMWFFSYLLNKGNFKIWQINNEIFYTISWDSSQIYGCTLTDTMMQKCWARNKTVFSPFWLHGVQFPFFHTVFPHTICFSDRRL